MIKEFKIARYYGMNNSRDASELRGSSNDATGREAELIENFLIRTSGKLIRRDGETSIGTDADTYVGLGLTHRVVGSTKTQIKVENTVIKSLSGGAWSAMSGAGATGLTAGLEMNFCQANDYVYGFNGTDNVRKIDATTVTTVAGIPVGKWAVWWQNYLFVGGVAAYPNRIYFSNLNTTETFSVDDYIDIEPGDGDFLTGAVGQTDKLTISKNYKFYYLTGSGTNTFSVTQVAVDFGCPSYRALRSVGTDVFCIDVDGAVRSVYRNQYGLMAGKDLSSDYLQLTQDSINKSALNKACSFLINGYFGMAVPTGTSLINDTVMLLDISAPVPDIYSHWTVITGWTPACFDVMFSSTEETLYIQDATAISEVYSWSGNTDNGTTITATYISANVADESPGIRKRNLYLKWFGFPLGDYDADVYSSIDRSEFTNIGSLNLLGNSGVWGTFVWGVGIWGSVGTVMDKIHYGANNGKTVGKYRQLKLVYANSSDACEIGTLVSYYKVMRFRL